MRVLYVAAGIPVPGTVGGSTHVLEVSRGLAALGHEVLVVAGAEEASRGARRLKSRLGACGHEARLRGLGRRGRACRRPPADDRAQPLSTVSGRPPDDGGAPTAPA